MRLKSTLVFSSTLYSRFAPPVARNLKKLDAEGSRRVRLNSQQPCPHICRRGLLDKISLFFLFDNVFIKSSKMPPDCCFFLYLYPLEQCAPSKCSSHLSIFNLLYHPPSLPPVPPLLLQAFILKGVKFLLCILISEKLSPSTFSLNS